MYIACLSGRHPPAGSYPYDSRASPRCSRSRSRPRRNSATGLWHGGMVKVCRWCSPATARQFFLSERRTGVHADLVRRGRDDEASRIICETIAKLHSPKSGAIPDLIPRSQWFGELIPAADIRGGMLSRSAATAQALFGSERNWRAARRRLSPQYPLLRRAGMASH